MTNDKNPDCEVAMKLNRSHNRRKAGGLIVALVTLMVVMLIAGSIVRSLVTDARESRQALIELQAHQLADAALARAAAMLTAQPDYTGETWQTTINPSDETDTAVAEIRVESTAEPIGPRKVTIEARYPDHPW